MLISQEHEENEGREGRMFMGPSGEVLDELLRADNSCAASRRCFV